MHLANMAREPDSRISTKFAEEYVIWILLSMVDSSIQRDKCAQIKRILIFTKNKILKYQKSKTNFHAIYNFSKQRLDKRGMGEPMKYAPLLK